MTISVVARPVNISKVELRASSSGGRWELAVVATCAGGGCASLATASERAYAFESRATAETQLAPLLGREKSRPARKKWEGKRSQASATSFRLGHGGFESKFP